MLATLRSCLAFFRGSNYSKKLLALSLAYLLPFLMVLYCMVQAQNRIVSVQRVELEANNYEQLLRLLFEKIAKHKLLAHRFLEDASDLKETLLALETKINYDFSIFLAYDDRVQDSLQTRPQDFLDQGGKDISARELQEEWVNIQKKLFSLTPQANDQVHNELLENIRDLMTYSVSLSSLLRDPSTDSLIESLYLLLINQEWLIQKIAQDGYNLVDFPDQKAELQKQISLKRQNLEDSLRLMSLRISKSLIRPRHLDSNAVDSIRTSFEQYQDTTQSFFSFIDNTLLAPTPITNEASIYSEANKVASTGFALFDIISGRVKELIENEVTTLRTQQNSIVLFSFTALIGGLFVSIWIIRSLSLPLKNLVDATKKLSEGKLMTRVEVLSRDEVGLVGEAFNQMADVFSSLIERLQKTAMQLATSTLEIAASAREQESIVLQQESSTKEIAMTAREISTISRDFAETMNLISHRAEETSTLASSGKNSLNQMESIMSQMVEASTNIGYKLGVLSEKAGSITGIISTINKFAEQTNLLSLNAAIEAEKAGEHGKSFSVIAREIRRLADQTATATYDVEKMVNEMTGAVSASVMSVDKFSEEIRTGVQEVISVSEQLSQIIERVEQQTTSFENVNKGMQSQSMSAEQINESISQLSAAAQQTTEAIRHFHGTIEHLNKAGKEIQAIVSNLQGRREPLPENFSFSG